MMADVAPSSSAYHVGSMERARAVLRTVLEDAPGSIRELAREAGLAHVTLIQVRDGDRNLTRERWADLVAALRRWEDRCGHLADELEDAALGESPTDQEDHHA